jgi:hypothetical protein
MDYTCYVHVPGKLAPEVRFFSATEEDAISENLAQMVHEWPSYEMIEVFDQDDQPVLQEIRP